MRLQSRRMWKMGNLSRKEQEQVQRCAAVSVEKVAAIAEMAPFRRNLALCAGRMSSEQDCSRTTDLSTTGSTMEVPSRP